MSFLIVDMSFVNDLDFSAAEAFVRIQRLLAAKKVLLAFCGVVLGSEAAKALQSVNLWGGAEDSTVATFATLNDALEWTENEYLTVMYQDYTTKEDDEEPKARSESTVFSSFASLRVVCEADVWISPSFPAQTCRPRTCPALATASRSRTVRVESTSPKPAWTSWPLVRPALPLSFSPRTSTFSHQTVSLPSVSHRRARPLPAPRPLPLRPLPLLPLGCRHTRRPSPDPPPDVLVLHREDGGLLFPAQALLCLGPCALGRGGVEARRGGGWVVCD